MEKPINFTIPFQPGQRLLELCGGKIPIIRPNMDVRAGENVDIVGDISKPLPFSDNSLDGILCKFGLEHISWRLIPAFLKEIYRVLDANGQAIFITANLYEQAKTLTKSLSWNHHNISMIFGDNDYDQNTHRAGWSPSYAAEQFTDAGFARVLIYPWIDAITDMVIEVQKGTEPPKQVQETAFDSKYFHGGHYESYRDFPSNYTTYTRIKSMNPSSVLEIGCARGYVLKRLQDAGVPGAGLEISHHCILTRVCDGINEYDITKTPWPFEDKSFDVCYSNDLFNSLSPEHHNKVLDEARRVSKRQLHTTDLPSTKSEYIPKPDDKVRVNCGCFTNMFYQWYNLDVINLNSFAEANGYTFTCHDCRKPLPFKDNSVDAMYSSHMLEHLTYLEGKAFLRECFRIMKPGATFRLMVPDCNKVLKYENIKDLAEMSDGVRDAKTDLEAVSALLVDGHKSLYNFDTLKALAEPIGLTVLGNVYCNFRQGNKEILSTTIDMLEPISLFVELVKPV